MNNQPLFDGRLVRLAGIDPEKDAETMARWTQDPDYLLRFSLDAPRLLSPPQMKKRLEEEEKQASEKRTLFPFALRLRADDRLVGHASLSRLEWTNGSGDLALALGAADDRGRGLGADALRLLLRYAFGELNLYRLAASTSDYNPRAARFLEQHGFQLEARRRQALWRDGQAWDVLWYGLLRAEWEQQPPHPAGENAP